MAQRGVAASFWRGGTSRGLLLSAKSLATFNRPVLDEIIRVALGSPDPARRQISGLGGGVSSLSKACIIGCVGDGVKERAINNLGPLPGVSWADDGSRDGVGEWEIIYRFAQVGIADSTLDWTATCGNMLSAVALHVLSDSLLPRSLLVNRAKSLPQPPPGSPLLLPISILSASNGLLMKARVPVDPVTLEVWEPESGEGTVIAGVPGEALGIEIELPIEEVEGTEGGLVTGRPRDTITVEGKEIEVSIISSGLPNIFLDVNSLQLEPDILSSSLGALTAHPRLPKLLETIRVATATQFAIPLSLASPKIVLVSTMPAGGYPTSVSTHVQQAEADILVRAVSSGDFHATIPATTLGALNVAAGTQGSVVNELIKTGRVGVDSEKSDSTPPPSTPGPGEEIVSVRAGHPAGTAESTVKFVIDEGGRRKPTSVIMMRTAREIMRGEVMIPREVFSRT